MTQLIEADLGALQTLITYLQTIDTETDNLQNGLTTNFNNFDGTFLAPQKAQLQQDIQDLWNTLYQADIKADALKGKLQTLLTDLTNLQNVQL